MLRSFNLAQLKWKDPRVTMRVLLGVLLLANLAAAVAAFKPFGGSAEDLRLQQQALQQRLAQLRKQVDHSKRMAAKVQTARAEGDEFLDKYVTDRRVVTSTIQSELMELAKNAGVTFLPTTFPIEQIEGSAMLAMMTINGGCVGTYANLAKFVNLVDKSDRFLILENMVVSPQQSGQNLNVTMRIDTFVKESSGEVE
jgi:type IV pilus assembly protein PilO